MILPTKHLSPERSIISVSSEVLELIGRRSTVSSIWNSLQEKHKASLRFGDVPFDWFILALDFFFLIAPHPVGWNWDIGFIMGMVIIVLGLLLTRKIVLFL